MQPNAKDWMVFLGVDAETVARGIQESISMFTPESAVTHVVNLYRLESGGIGVTAAPPLPPYYSMNCCLWIGGVGSEIAAQGAGMWTQSPSSGIRYFLAPDNRNKAGDTLFGIGNDGDYVMAYAPEGQLWKSHEALVIPEEPTQDLDTPIASFEVQTDSQETFGNPQLLITGPPA